jgi:hypothetical protein
MGVNAGAPNAVNSYRKSVQGKFRLRRFNVRPSSHSGKWREPVDWPQSPSCISILDMTAARQNLSDDFRQTVK